MGIDDRDYMRERRLRAMEHERSRGSSWITIVLFWCAIGLAMYVAYDWVLQAKRAGPRPAGAAPAPEPGAGTHRPAPSAAAAAADDAAPARRGPAERARPDLHVEPARDAAARHSAPTTGGTIYLCRAYSGATFWAQAHCGEHQALIDSIVPVPAGLAFEQQVELARQHRQELARTVYAAPAPQAAPGAAATKRADCEALDRRVETLDAMARQPQSAQVQDWLRGERQAARDRQFRLRC